ncbi:MAG TPA: cytochrome P450 [Mycobacterium sp.]|nr:cytochrome P450 [Mycobacterium sp.]
MTLSQNVQFAGSLVKPLGTAARINAVSGVRARWHAHRVPIGAETTTYDPLDSATAAHPHAAYRRLHDGARVQYNPKRSVWILSRLEDVRAAARADAALSSADGVTRTKFSLPILITTDGERHAQMRRQILPAFTKVALDAWRPMIDGLAAELVGDVLDNPGCDVVQRLAVPMPMRLIAHMLGVPDSDVDEFRRWSEAAVQVTDLALSRRGVGKLAGSVSGSRSIYRYFHRQFKAGGLKGSDTILGRLLAKNEAGSITEDELFYFAMLLLLAGNETTTNLLGGMFDTLAREPHAYQRIRSDQTLIPMAIEEQLRYSSPVQNLYRTARTDYAVGDVTIPAGARVLLSFGAANRDPQAFDEPDIYRIDRNPNQHIAFGFGAHLCLGAHLTRMEADAVLRELVTRVDRIELVGETRWSTNSSLRGPAHMRVRLTPA